MKITLPAKTEYHWPRLLQQSGYHQHQRGYVKRLSSEYYPRYHLYLLKEDENKLLFELHLDQRRAVHAHAKAHAADSDGPLVEQERERLEKTFNQYLIK